MKREKGKGRKWGKGVKRGEQYEGGGRGM